MKVWRIHKANYHSAIKKNEVRVVGEFGKYSLKRGDPISERKKSHILLHIQTLAYSVDVEIGVRMGVICNSTAVFPSHGQ